MMLLSLNLFGGFRLMNQSHEIVLAGNKARALAAYLSLSNRRAESRDHLLGLLWENYSERSGRQGLRHALHCIRRALGPESVMNTQDGVTLADNIVRTDVCEFLSNVDMGTISSFERAAQIYSGNLLEGLSVHAPAFETWLSGERGHLNTVASDVFFRLIRQHLHDGGYDRAVEMAENALDLDPYNEAVQRMALTALYHGIGRTRALQQFEKFRQVLHEDLGIDPESATLRLVDRMRTGDLEIPQSSTSSSRSVELKSQEDRRPYLSIVSTHEKPSEITSRIVDELASSFSRLRWIDIVISDGVRAKKDRCFAIDVRRNGDATSRFILRLISLNNGVLVWTKAYDLASHADAALAVGDAVATCEQVMMDTLALTSSRHGDAFGDHKDDIRRAYMQYRCMTRDTCTIARALLLDVLQAKPYSVGALQIASFIEMSHVLNGWTDQPLDHVNVALTHASRAMQLIQYDYLSHGAVALPLLFKRHYDSALREAGIAADLNPHSVTSQGILGIVCAYSGESLRAIEACTKALDYDASDPCMSEYRWAHAAALLSLGRLDESAEVASAANLLHPDNVNGYILAGAALALAGDLAEATNALHEAHQHTTALSLDLINDLLPYRRPGDFERIIDGLDRIGWRQDHVALGA